MNFNILLCADSNYYFFVKRLVKNIKNIADSYSIHIYDLGLEAWQRKELERHNVRIEKTRFQDDTFKINSLRCIKATHKIDCIEDFINRYRKNIIVLDADILFIENVFTHLHAEKEQIILTRRCRREWHPDYFKNGKINTGVMSFGSEMSSSFFAAWRKLACEERHSDQSALSALIEPHVDWDILEKEQDSPWGKVKLLDGNIYNDVTCREGKVLHFKQAGRIKKKRVRYKIFASLCMNFPSLTKKIISFNRKKQIAVWKKN